MRRPLLPIDASSMPDAIFCEAVRFFVVRVALFGGALGSGYGCAGLGRQEMTGFV